MYGVDFSLSSYLTFRYYTHSMGCDTAGFQPPGWGICWYGPALMPGYCWGGGCGWLGDMPIEGLCKAEADTIWAEDIVLSVAKAFSLVAWNWEM